MDISINLIKKYQYVYHVKIPRHVWKKGGKLLKIFNVKTILEIK
jgi:hypothetical protein